MKPIYSALQERKSKGIKSFAVLLDPDKLDDAACKRMVKLGIDNKIDFFFVGGSLLTDDSLSRVIQYIKSESKIPAIIFPGSNNQICNEADAILLLSLISGRNADALIGQHVIAAPILKLSGLEVLATGYMLVESGRQTTASYISNTTPLPHDKPAIAACTAMAGEMLGLQLIYMDAGSGAQRPIPTAMIQEVAKHIQAPLIIGGGITTPEKAIENCKAGADIIVIGNAVEKDPSLIKAMAEAIHSLNK